MKRVGIDIGSTTVKIAVLDDNNNILFSAYERHYANIQETLRAIMERAYNELGDCDIAPMITGSGGLSISKHLDSCERCYFLKKLCSSDRCRHRTWW